jgi:hypothetical protein
VQAAIPRLANSATTQKLGVKWIERTADELRSNVQQSAYVLSIIDLLPVYTHVLNKGGRGVKSLLDRLEQKGPRYALA